MVSRRAFLERALTAAALRAGIARAASAAETAKLFDIERAAPGVFLALARPAVLVNCNAVIFELASGLLVVDTHSKPSAAAALIAQIRREVSPRPVRYIVNTHFHYDHAHGNAAYRRLKPEVSIISSRSTRDTLANTGAKAIAASVESMRRTLEENRQKLREAGSSPAGAFLQRAVSEAESYIREMSGALPDLPDFTFDGSFILHDRGQELRLVFHGRAHTASDICVLSPSRKLVATGDLVVGFIPGMGDGFPLEWPATLQSLGGTEFTGILPGHGALQRDRTAMAQMRGYIEELTERVASAKRSGQSLDEVQRSIRIASLKSIDGDWGRYVAAMTARYRWLEPGADPRGSIEAGVRSNIAAIFAHAG